MRRRIRRPLPPPHAEGDGQAAEERPDDERGRLGDSGGRLEVYIYDVRVAGRVFQCEGQTINLTREAVGPASPSRKGEKKDFLVLVSRVRRHLGEGWIAVGAVLVGVDSECQLVLPGTRLPLIPRVAGALMLLAR